MFLDLIEKKRVTVMDRADNWIEAVRAAAKPLLDQGAIEESYIDAMIACVKEAGSYIVIAPNIALPHARVGDGVNETSISFMKLNEPVIFGEGEDSAPANLLIVLATRDMNEHTAMLMDVVSIFENDETVDKFLAAKTVEDIKQIFLK